LSKKISGWPMNCYYAQHRFQFWLKKVAKKITRHIPESRRLPWHRTRATIIFIILIIIKIIIFFFIFLLCKVCSPAARVCNLSGGLQTPGAGQKRLKRAGLHPTRGSTDPSEQVCRPSTRAYRPTRMGL
jgi:hypothetical protein